LVTNIACAMVSLGNHAPVGLLFISHMQPMSSRSEWSQRPEPDDVVSSTRVHALDKRLSISFWKPWMTCIFSSQIARLICEVRRCMKGKTVLSALRSQDLPVILEDEHILVVNKPAGLPAQADRRGGASLCSMARSYLRCDPPGRSVHPFPFVGLIHRLDKDVTGVCVLAKTKAAARDLSAQFATRRVSKEYIGVVRRWEPGGAREVKHWLRVDDTGFVHEATPGSDGSLVASLTCQPLKVAPSGATAVLVRLHTGRKHQIRFQLAACSSPLLGDPRYGHGTRDGSRKWIRRPALHSWRLRFEHPKTGAICQVVAPLPLDIASLLSAIQIKPEALISDAVETSSPGC